MNRPGKCNQIRKFRFIEYSIVQSMNRCIKTHFKQLLPSMALAALFVVTFHGAQAQMDTLYFEDFVDNRRGWDTIREEKYVQIVEDGFLRVESDKGSGTTSYSYVDCKLDAPDRFIYEVRIVPEELRFGGIAYKFHFRKQPLKNGKRRLCCYNAYVADWAGLYSFIYSRGDNRQTPNFVQRDPNMDRSEHVFRVELRDGMVYYYHNGEEKKSHRDRPWKKTDPWQHWGFLSRGKARYKVDYILLMGQGQ